jgi:hypothetical protein
LQRERSLDDQRDNNHQQQAGIATHRIIGVVRKEVKAPEFITLAKRALGQSFANRARAAAAHLAWCDGSKIRDTGERPPTCAAVRRRAVFQPELFGRAREPQT